MLKKYLAKSRFFWGAMCFVSFNCYSASEETKTLQLSESNYYGKVWPLEVADGVVLCGSDISFMHQGKIFSLTGTTDSLGENIPHINQLFKKGMKTKDSYMEFIREVLFLCKPYLREEYDVKFGDKAGE